MENLAGRRFGRLLVLRTVKRLGKTHWECRCDCGTTKAVMASNLKIGCTRSCGCLHREQFAASKTRHGLSKRGHKTPEYVAWANIVGRCENPNDAHYALYGGRGITVCQQWRADVVAFVRDMGPRPSRRHSIDRIDNDGHYSPENCRWATQKQQCSNYSRNRQLTFRGETLTMSGWARRLGMAPNTLKRRLFLGWPIDRALTQPVRRQ